MESAKRYINPATVAIFIIAFLLGYGTASRLVYRYDFSAGQPAEESARPSAGAETEEAEAPAAGEGESGGSPLTPLSAFLGGAVNAIAADNQPAGSSVAVGVKLDKAAWAVVHEDAAGQPGRILGAQLFASGTHSGKVDLLRTTSAGMKYYVILHSDDGDRRFDHTKDLPLKNQAGAAITDEFTASAAVLNQ